MKVAMPIFGNRVSPRFDCANTFLVATVTGQEISVRHELDATEWTLRDRIARLIALDVNVVVCGGIDRWSAGMLRDAGIDLYSWVTGTSEENLAALLQGKLNATHAPDRTRAAGGVGQDQAVSRENQARTRGAKEPPAAQSIRKHVSRPLEN